MIPEAALRPAKNGLAPDGEGWYVLNAREARWFGDNGRGASCNFEGEARFPQLGINLNVLQPGEPMAMYHWEADQEDFLVLAGEAELIIEGEERILRAWDFVHCPAGAAHVIVGHGDRPCLVLAVGARERSTGTDWGGYKANRVAKARDASVDEDTDDVGAAYARFPKGASLPYAEGWLPDVPAPRSGGQ